MDAGFRGFRRGSRAAVVLAMTAAVLAVSAGGAFAFSDGQLATALSLRGVICGSGYTADVDPPNALTVTGSVGGPSQAGRPWDHFFADRHTIFHPGEESLCNTYNSLYTLFFQQRNLEDEASRVFDAIMGIPVTPISPHFTLDGTLDTLATEVSPDLHAAVGFDNVLYLAIDAADSNADTFIFISDRDTAEVRAMPLGKSGVVPDWLNWDGEGGFAFSESDVPIAFIETGGTVSPEAVSSASLAGAGPKDEFTVDLDQLFTVVPSTIYLNLVTTNASGEIATQTGNMALDATQQVPVGLSILRGD